MDHIEQMIGDMIDDVDYYEPVWHCLDDLKAHREHLSYESACDALKYFGETAGELNLDFSSGTVREKVISMAQAVLAHVALGRMRPCGHCEGRGFEFYGSLIVACTECDRFEQDTDAGRHARNIILAAEKAAGVDPEFEPFRATDILKEVLCT